MGQLIAVVALLVVVVACVTMGHLVVVVVAVGDHGTADRDVGAHGMDTCGLQKLGSYLQVQCK